MNGGQQHPKKSNGFSLAEILIGLALLAVLAAFAIPKIFNSNNTDYRYKVQVQEAVHMIGAAYTKFRNNANPSSTTSFNDILHYINYVKLKTSGTIDLPYGSAGSLTCNNGAAVGALKCLVMPNGAIVSVYDYVPTCTFQGTSLKHALAFYVDPDAKVTGTGAANDPGKSVMLALYFDGTIRDRGNTKPNTADCTVADWGAPAAWQTPPYFNWN